MTTRNAVYLSFFVILSIVSSFGITPIIPDNSKQINTLRPSPSELTLGITSLTSFKNYANLTNHGGGVVSVAFSPDDKLLASSSIDGSIHIWNTSDGQILQILLGHHFFVASVSFSIDGQILASCGNERLNLWNVSSGQLIKSSSLIESPSRSWYDVKFSPINSSVLAVSQGNNVELWDIESQTIIHTLSGHTGALLSVEFSDEGKILATSSADSSVKTWNVTSGGLINTFSHPYYVYSVAFWDSDSKIITGGDPVLGSGGVRLWDISNGSLLHTFYTNKTVRSISVSSDILAVGEGNVTFPAPDQHPKHSPILRLWNLSSKTRIVSLSGHKNSITAVQFSHDGTILASVSLDRTIKLWGDHPAILPSFQDDYWPESSPEEQGLGSIELNKISNELSKFLTHSMLVIRNGMLVYENYYPGVGYDYTRWSKHALFSAGKSFVSTLVGIALDLGFITSLDQKVLDFFPNMTFANMDSRKEAITLEQVLLMTSGMTVDLDFWHMMTSPDPIQYLLDLPMTHDPGTFWNYNSGSSPLLSAIVQAATGMNSFDFGMQYLMEPLGMDRSDVLWMRDPQGRVYGDLYLTPRNMAKLGQLFLNNGSWNGVQIVSKEWVTNATRNRPYGYGYQWWTNEDYYTAVGYNGQEIIVIPDDDMVVVFTSGGYRGPSNYVKSIRQATHFFRSPLDLEYTDSKILNETTIVSWNAVNDSFDHPVVYTLHYSADNGSTWQVLVENTTNTYFSWDTTAVSKGDAYMLKLQSLCSEGKIMISQSDSAFSILNHIMNDPILNFPNGGETLTTISRLTWKKVVDLADHEVSYDVYYSMDAGTSWESLAEDLSSTLFTWDIGTYFNGEEYLIKVVATCTEELISEDVSDSVFSLFSGIDPPTTTTTTTRTETTDFNTSWGVLLLILGFLSRRRQMIS
ncbi:MAG: serine hydrolase [Candidatus Hodarchaeales archaeon]|jgi:WD40 repeat protein